MPAAHLCIRAFGAVLNFLVVAAGVVCVVARWLLFNLVAAAVVIATAVISLLLVLVVVNDLTTTRFSGVVPMLVLIQLRVGLYVVTVCRHGSNESDHCSAKKRCL